MTVDNPSDFQARDWPEPFTFTQPVGKFVSAVLEVEKPEAAQYWHDWLLAQSGVRGVEVVFVHWEENEVAHVDA